jgi:hypothetical protein
MSATPRLYGPEPVRQQVIQCPDYLGLPVI